MTRRNERSPGIVKQIKRQIEHGEPVEIDMAEEIAEQIQHSLPDRPAERERLQEDLEYIIRGTVREGLRIPAPGGGLMQPVGAKGEWPSEQLNGIDRDLPYVTTDFKEDPECGLAFEIQILVDHDEAEVILTNTPGRDEVDWANVSAGDTFADVEGDDMTIAAMGEATCLVRLYVAPYRFLVNDMKEAASNNR